MSYILAWSPPIKVALKGWWYCVCVSYSIYVLQRLATPQCFERPIDLNMFQGFWGTLSQNSHPAKLHSFGPVSGTSGQRDRKHVHNNGLPDRPTGSHCRYCRRVMRLHDNKDGWQVTKFWEENPYKHAEHCRAKCIKDSSMIRAQSSDFLSISISHCMSETFWDFHSIQLWVPSIESTILGNSMHTTNKTSSKQVRLKWKSPCVAQNCNLALVRHIYMLCPFSHLA